MPSTLQHLPDATATKALGRELATQWLLSLSAADDPKAAAARPAAQRPPILLLQGDLGAGKTCLVQGLAEGLGIAEPVTSPTFALAQHYQGTVTEGPLTGTATALVHLDLYRLEHPAAADELFAQEEEEARALGALLAVEWPERLSAQPEGAWLLQLSLRDADDPEAGRIAQLHR